MQRLIGIVIALVIFSMLFGVIEFLFAAQPKRKREKGELRTDIVYWFFSPIITKTMTRLGVILVAIVPVLLMGKDAFKAQLINGWGVIPMLPVAAQGFVALLLLDFISYWGHRIFHTSRLWRIHAVHHSSRTLDWLAAVRGHPLNQMTMRIVQAVVLFAVGVPLNVLTPVLPLFVLYGLLLHTNVPWDFGPFRYVLASPQFHRWHHTSEEEGLDKNFAGIFPVWALIFGTFYMPKGKQPVEFGVLDDDMPSGLWGQLKYPFQRS